MTKQERLIEAFTFLQYEGIVRSKADVARKMGAVRSSVSSAFNGNEAFLTDNFLLRFSAAFKQISLDWLLNEIGTMLTIEAKFGTENTPMVMECDEDKDVIEEQKKITGRINELIQESGEIARTFALKSNIELSLFQKKIKGQKAWSVADVHKICDTFRIRKGWLVDGEGQKYRASEEMLETIPALPAKPNSNGIPLIPVNAMAGALSGDSITVEPWDIEDWFIIPSFKKSDFCIRVDGDSMEPRYKKGDIIACTRVPLTNLWFQWGKVYVLDTRQGALVKHVEKGSDDQHILLVSDNEDYKPFEIPTSELFGVAIVNGLIRIE